MGARKEPKSHFLCWWGRQSTTTHSLPLTLLISVTPHLFLSLSPWQWRLNMASQVLVKASDAVHAQYPYNPEDVVDCTIGDHEKAIFSPERRLGAAPKKETSAGPQKPRPKPGPSGMNCVQKHEKASKRAKKKNKNVHCGRGSNRVSRRLPVKMTKILISSCPVRQARIAHLRLLLPIPPWIPTRPKIAEMLPPGWHLPCVRYTVAWSGSDAPSARRGLHPSVRRCIRPRAPTARLA